MGRLSVNLCGEELDNPVIPASGTFGYGYDCGVRPVIEISKSAI